MSRASSARRARRDRLLVNTHDFLVRLFDRGPGGTRAVARADQRRRIPQRATPVRALGGSGAGSASIMSPAEPFDSFSERFLRAARAGDHDFILVSQVMFGSGRMFDQVEELAALGQPEGPWVVIDGYHAFMALDRPFGRGRCASPLSTSAEATNMRWRAKAAPSSMRPPGFGPRPPITGWFAEFEDLSLPPGSVGYAKDATPLPRRDLRSLGACTASTPSGECWPTMA